MKNKGYTLAEALIAIGVIGVIAAVMLPMMNKFKPDEDKVLFIKTYDAIVEATSYLTNNGGEKDIYPQIIEDIKYTKPNDETDTYTLNFTDAPLLNRAQVELFNGQRIPNHFSSQGNNNNYYYNDKKYWTYKYCHALTYNMHSPGASANLNECSFTLINNVQIMVSPYKSFYQFPFLDGKAADVRIKTPKNDKVFKLIVFPNGHIVPDPDNADTVRYIMTRGNWKKTNKEPENFKDKRRQYRDEIEYWGNWGNQDENDQRNKIKCYDSKGEEVTIEAGIHKIELEYYNKINNPS